MDKGNTITVSLFICRNAKTDDVVYLVHVYGFSSYWRLVVKDHFNNMLFTYIQTKVIHVQLQSFIILKRNYLHSRKV
jgi:hypothetical protein